MSTPEWVESELWVIAAEGLELEEEDNEADRRTDDECDNEGDKNSGPLLSDSGL